MRLLQGAILVAGLVLATNIHPAAAFTTEKGSDMMGGNPSNFTDPDEQMPAYLSAPGEQSSSMQMQMQSGQPVTPVGQSEATEQYLGLSQAFDRAYSQK